LKNTKIPSTRVNLTLRKLAYKRKMGTRRVIGTNLSSFEYSPGIGGFGKG